MEQINLPRQSHYGKILFKAVLHTIVKGLVLTRRQYKRSPLGFILVVLLLIGGYYYLFQPAPQTYTAANGEPLATVDFVRGQSEHDAKKAWDGLSEAFKTELVLRGESFERNQKFLDLPGFSSHFTYLGGHTIPDGSSIQVYLGQYDYVTANGANSIQAPVTFTLDPEGKITSVTSKDFCERNILISLYCVPMPS